MATKKKLKAPAGVNLPQSRDDAAQFIHKIGMLQRELTRTEADMNDEIAAVTARYQPELDRMQQEIKTLQGGVQAWCDTNRAELTDGNKVKFANLVTGMVFWRARPPSVKLTGVEAVLQQLRVLGLQRFIRTTEEVNKDAILVAFNNAKNAPADSPMRAQLIAEAAPLNAVTGIKVVTGVEDFSIEPFEQEVTA